MPYIGNRTSTVNLGSYTKDQADEFFVSEQFFIDNQDLTESGYQILPGGLIIQWGSEAGSDTGPVEVNFPIIFTSSVLSISITPVGGNSGSPYFVGGQTNSDVSGFELNTYSDSGVRTTVTCKYIAIGY